MKAVFFDGAGTTRKGELQFWPITGQSSGKHKLNINIHDPLGGDSVEVCLTHKDLVALHDELAEYIEQCRISG